MSDKTTVSIKLKHEIRENLHVIASFRNRSPHFLMNEAISNYVETEVARINFIKAGELAARQYEETGKHITMAEFNDWVDALAVDSKSPLAPCHK